MDSLQFQSESLFTWSRADRPVYRFHLWISAWLLRLKQTHLEQIDTSATTTFECKSSFPCVGTVRTWTHRSRMAYPTDYNGSHHLSTHPIRLSGVFFEAFFSVDQFPCGQGTQPFLLSNGVQLIMVFTEISQVRRNLRDTLIRDLRSHETEKPNISIDLLCSIGK
jgi:hypothetical protein